MQRTSWLAVIVVAVAAATGTAQDLAGKLKDVKFEQYAKAPGYSEGPSWRNGELFFCSGALLRVDKNGKVAKYLDIGPAGTVFRGDGHLLICDNKHRALLVHAPDGTLGVLADKFDGKPLGSLNDLTVDKAGNIYWTDPEGSSIAKPIGKVYRLRPDGTVHKVAEGLAFPNGLDVDPAGEFLYVIESQSKKILRYKLPADDKPLGQPEVFFDLGGSGGDGCCFDADGNLWVADFHRPDTKQGQITVLNSAGKVLARLPVPAKVVSNITFGGPNHDEIFCTTGDPPGVFRAKVGVKGFAGHPGKAMKPIRVIAVKPNELGSNVHPRRFGFPGGPGPSRGFFIWKKYDPKSRQAEIATETGETFTSYVLPWATTYRYLAYGANVDELLPGERVNLFFSPDERHRRGYLVHFQDELCQMKGHAHAWEVTSVDAPGFSARSVDGKNQPLDARTLTFSFAPTATHWRGGKVVDAPSLTVGQRLYLTWTDDGSTRKTVRLSADDASCDAIRKIEQAAIEKRLALEGMGAHVESVDGGIAQLLVFPTYWAQAQWKEGQVLEIRTSDSAATGKLVYRKNLGTYGSGPTEIRVQLAAESRLESGKMVKVRAAP